MYVHVIVYIKVNENWDKFPQMSFFFNFYDKGAAFFIKRKFNH